MAKRLIIYTMSLTVLIFITGCPQPVSEPAQAPIAQAPKDQPVKTEPIPEEPPKTEPAETEPQEPEPPQPEPPQAEPAEIVPPKPEPLEAEPAEIAPPKPEPPQAEPPKTEPPKQEPPKAQPPEVEPHPVVTFHNKCAGILNNFVDEKGLVNYKMLKRKKHELRTLLNEFAALEAGEYNHWPENDKIAFWLNAYNIQMLRVLVDNYPIESSRYLRVVWPPTSIRHIPPVRLVGTAKWNSYKFIVTDEAFTLSEIEQRFLRKQFNDPRIFIATFFGGISGPPLRNEPYYGHKLDKQLNDQAGKFLADPLAFRIDRKRQVVHLSAVFDPAWHGKSFARKYATDKKFKDHPPAVRAVLNFATKYISQPDVSYLEVENYDVRFIGYDWRLNDGSDKPAGD